MSELAPDKPELAPQPLDFPIIGIGASAGGLETFDAFIQAIDPELNATYILVQHLDPTHQSLLPELLARHAKLPVVQIEDGTPVRPRTICVIPSAAGLAIEDGQLSLVDFEAPRGFRRPIDDFFQSLAFDQGPNAAAIVLSGTGGDGTVGLRAVKEAGGIVMAQEPGQARYDGMPSSAISTGLVDFVLPVEEMPGTLGRYFAAREGQARHDRTDREELLRRVVEAVRHRTGHDFRHYKVNTLLRRIQRRMQILDVTEPDEYVAALVRSSSEAFALFQDLLINVTAFFRDPEAFDILRREVIPAIVREADGRRPIRVWVPGCSSGEEAYSIAILFAEAVERLDPAPEIQVFATDIDEEMLRRARRGTYQQSDLAEMPPELLERYFRLEADDTYVVADRVRETVRISAHSVIKDPPFSRIDLVSCRNLLIYFDARLQARVLPLFHYALRPEGWLLLGSAENVAGRDDLFETIHREERIYRKIGRSNANFLLPLNPGQNARAAPPRPTRVAHREERDERRETIQRRIMERYAPPHVVIDPEGRVVHASPRTAPFLALAQGEPSNRLLDLAPPPLRAALRSMLNALRERRRRVVRRGVELRTDDEIAITVDLVADPIGSRETMIVFREVARKLDEYDAEDEADVDDFQSEQRIRELEDELGEARSTLRTTVEELETSNEELKSSNEEMMSMNEELQSANEELSTVNEELKSKLEELAQANADLVNFLEATRIATVFVDRELRVRAHTPEATKLFRIAETDRGRPLLDLRTSLDPTMIEEAMTDVLAGRETEPRRVEGAEERVYIFRALPYRGSSDEIDGVVVTFDDITALDAAQRTASARLHELELIYENSPTGMAIIDSEHRYRRINAALAEYNGVAAEDHIGRTITEVLPEIGPGLDEALDRVLQGGETLKNWELAAPAPQDPNKDEVFELDLYPVPSEFEGGAPAAGVIVRRITEFRRLEAELRHVMGELQHRVKNTLATVLAIVRQTVRSDGDREALATALQSRIGALAQTHTLLTRADWREVRLRDILVQELAPYSEGNRVTMEGGEATLSSKAALNLTMVLHELTTNAVKHGALSDDGGALRVAWRVEDETFHLEWDEHGAHCSGPGDAKEGGGFGLRFIERSVRHDLDGTCDIVWKDGCLSARIGVPMATIRPTVPGA